jgi:hypothetical protein
MGSSYSIAHTHTHYLFLDMYSLTSVRTT